MTAVFHGGSSGTECDILEETRVEVWLSVQIPLLFSDTCTDCYSSNE